MSTFKHLHVILCLLLVTDSAFLVSSNQWFNGMAHVLVKPQDLSITGGLLSEIEDCLQHLIYMNISNSVILSSVSTWDNYLLSFGGTIQDVNNIPICLQNDTYQSEFGDNITYEIQSISLQTYNNEYMLENHCKDRNMSVAYIEYIEANCVTFMDSSCADNITNSAYRYDIYQGGTTLHTFYCINADDMSDETCPMTTGGNWFYLWWDSMCSLFGIYISQPQLTPLADSHLEERTTIQIDNLAPSWSCFDDYIIFMVPAIIHEGDLTFESLPTWLVTCLKVLSGLGRPLLLYHIRHLLRTPQRTWKERSEPPHRCHDLRSPQRRVHSSGIDQSSTLCIPSWAALLLRSCTKLLVDVCCNLPGLDFRQTGYPLDGQIVWTSYLSPTLPSGMVITAHLYTYLSLSPHRRLGSVWRILLGKAWMADLSDGIRDVHSAPSGLLSVCVGNFQTSNSKARAGVFQ